MLPKPSCPGEMVASLGPLASGSHRLTAVRSPPARSACISEADSEILELCLPLANCADLRGCPARPLPPCFNLVHPWGLSSRVPPRAVRVK